MSYTNPVLLKALFTSLMEDAGVAPADITVYDVSRLFPDYMVELCTQGELKGVNFVGRNNGVADENAPIVWSHEFSGRVNYLPTEGASITKENDTWQQATFNGKYTASVLVSQDPVAIDSVGADFLSNKPTVTSTTWPPPVPITKTIFMRPGWWAARLPVRSTLTAEVMRSITLVYMSIGIIRWRRNTAGTWAGKLALNWYRSSNDLTDLLRLGRLPP